MLDKFALRRLRRSFWHAALVTGLLWLALAAPALAGKRIALVVGNSAYELVGRLANPGNDAKLVGASLKAAGFTLIGGDALLNLDKIKFERAVAEFGHSIDGADVALFYYSGHGLQVDGNNYLVPVDANPSRRQDLDLQMIRADLVLGQMSGSGTKLNILIFDACRNNPFEAGLRSLGGGLAEMKAPEGTLISYATQPGAVASDGTGQDSPFTLSLVSAIRQPGLGIFDLFNHVGLDVKRITEGQQQPWMSASPIEGQFSFLAAPAPVAVPVPAPAAPPVETGTADSKSTGATAGHASPTSPGSGRPQQFASAGTVAPLQSPLLPEHAPGEFACPAKDWTVFGEDELFDWAGDNISVRHVNSGWFWHALGSDPSNPHMCLRSGKGGVLHRLVGWFDLDGYDFPSSPEQPLLALVQGRARDMTVQYAQRHPSGTAATAMLSARWHLRGHESFSLGGHNYDTMVFDVAETNAKGTGTGAGRTWYAPALGLFVRRVWRNPGQDDVTGFTIVGVSANGAERTDVTAEGGK